MQGYALWGWVIKGMCGILTLLENCVCEHAPATEAQFEELEKCQMRLSKIVNHVSVQIFQHPAPPPNPPLARQRATSQASDEKSNPDYIKSGDSAVKSTDR